MTHPSQDALQREQLKDALHSFSSASERLETAYARLEAEVSSLKAALATTTDERDAALAHSADASPPAGLPASAASAAWTSASTAAQTSALPLCPRIPFAMPRLPIH